MTKFEFSMIGFWVGAILMMIIISIITSEEPKAIDVYKGLTTLEITYRDSIPVDSVVVFKYD